ncbi:MAG: 2-hydroxyacyl-CoA dehydratase, partial [Syntrophorhabdaceae bacterium]|nr:2-hydroxyacyl-CoA dehydratase [Syntrophorhabdaceae bacterium]
MWDNLSLKEVVEYTKDPFPSIRKWLKEKGKKAVGSTIPDVPEEVIYAFGFLPVTLVGTDKPLKKAASRLPDNACSLARSNLELVLSYEGDLFDGFVLPQVCDTTQHLSDIWRISFPDKYVESFLAPRQVDRPSARYWVKEEIERLIESMSKWTGRGITDNDLKRAINLYNETKRLLKEIYNIKKKNPATITNKEFFSLVKLSMQVDKEEFNQSLKKIKDNLTPQKGDGYMDIVLAGITCDPPEVYDLLDEIKLNIVADTLVTGSRYINGIVSDNDNPIDALVDRHMKRS